MEGQKVTNPFKAGQMLLCVSESFPKVVCEGNVVDENAVYGEQPFRHPKFGERIAPDEVWGDFLRFDKYDDPSDPDNPQMWWHYTRFRCLEEAKRIYIETVGPLPTEN